MKTFVADPPGSVLYSRVTCGKLERSGSSITEGIGQGRITDNLAGMHIDGAVRREDPYTIATLFSLLKTKGLYLGFSSALNIVAAGNVARKLRPGHTVVTVLCDNAGRYRYTPGTRPASSPRACWRTRASTAPSP